MGTPPTAFLIPVHPIVELGFFLCAIGLGVFLLSPPFALVGAGAAALTLLLLQGRSAGRLIGAAVPLAAVVALANPLFVPLGQTVLFTYAGGRPYPAEALACGATVAALLAAVLWWFASFNRVMDTVKLLYLFGRFAPAVSLTLTLVLRLVPSFGRRASAVAEARAGIGLGRGSGTKVPAIARVREATVVLASVSAWSLEHGMATAGAMESRGFGTGRRTTVPCWSFRWRDGAALGLMGALAAVVVAGAALGATEATFFPRVAMPAAEPMFGASLAAYGLLLLLPALVMGRERLRWHFSRARR